MKTYNLFKQIFLLLALVLPFSSCTEDKMDDINENKNNPEDMQARFIITDAMAKTAFSVTGTDYNYYASVFIEHNVGTYGQMYNAEIRVSEPTSASTYGNAWRSSYECIWYLRIIIDKCSDGGAEEGNYHTMGISQILMAYNIAVLTDLMGDVPWTEAGKPTEIPQPKLDKQEDIYSDIFALLNEGIANLEKESSYASLGTQDLIYGGDADKWIKAAWGLKARYAMRLSHRNPQYRNVIDWVDESFADAGEQFQFNYNGSTTVSPMYKFHQDRLGNLGSSQSLYAKIEERNDPRESKFFLENSGELAPNGKPEQNQAKYGTSALSSPTAPTYLLSYHELQFLKAEAYARLNNTTEALNALSKAITAAFEKVGLTEDEADEYFESIQGRLNTNLLEEIMVQKYLAFYEEESMEAYNDYRRLTAMGNENFIRLSNANNPAKFPKRYTYGDSDVSANENIGSIFGNGSYVYEEPVWWAGGTR
ncbi:MAG: SusD/RagB family nutrient-binding outer membrane lipoprotein [Bacteroidales bacterium]|jgi:hypothetical protein|nr:SusD/RagB family nutrient-binding outer membrane lipoprotein [Bacteroidales bacterium]